MLVVRCWVVAVLASLMTVVVGVSQAGASGHRNDHGSPALAKPTRSGSTLVFTGAALPRSKVRLQTRVSSGWAAVGRATASRRGSFRITLPSPGSTSRFRVASKGRVSKVREVAPVAPAPAVAPVAPVPVVAEKPAPSDACGEQPARPDGGFYQCTFVDHFGGSALDGTYWHVMDGMSEGAACTVNSPETVSVGGGVLRLTARAAVRADQCPLRADGTRAAYVTGSVNTFWKWSQQYGRFEARMKSQAVSFSGPQEGFWLWPDTRYSSDVTWPASGEIDVAETYATYPDLAIPFLHYTADDNGGPVPGLNTAWNCVAQRGAWHTYVLEWTASKLVIKVDGTTCLTNTDGASSFRKPFIMAFSQLLAGEGLNKVEPATFMPTSLQVDYVKVWQ